MGASSGQEERVLKVCLTCIRGVSEMKHLQGQTILCRNTTHFPRLSVFTVSPLLLWKPRTRSSHAFQWVSYSDTGHVHSKGTLWSCLEEKVCLYKVKLKNVQQTSAMESKVRPNISYISSIPCPRS